MTRYTTVCSGLILVYAICLVSMSGEEDARPWPLPPKRLSCLRIMGTQSRTT